MAGARVVPIRADLPKEKRVEMFNSINGFIIPGGDSLLINGSDYSNYTIAGKHFIDMAIDANDNGDYFPVYTVCNGIEMLGIVISEDITTLN